MAQASSRNVVSCFLHAAFAWLAPCESIAGRVHPNLEATLAAKPPGEMVPIIIELESRANPSTAAAAHRGNRQARRNAVVEALRDVSNRTQKPLLQALAAEQPTAPWAKLSSFWIFNGLSTTATQKAIARIAARPEVREVRLDRTIAPPRLKTAVTPAPASAEAVWNITQIRAPEVWALDPAYDGTGIVIGSFDTGVDVTHPDLAPRYRGNHAISWFDPYHQHSTPVDPNGHGTHTTGTALGGDASGFQIGVAPGAKWIAAKAWNDRGNATVSAFHRIFEWFLAPGGDPANAPHIVNNSWGMDPPDCFLGWRHQAWRAAGIFRRSPSNDGQGAGRCSRRAITRTFAVGATDPDDVVAEFSGEDRRSATARSSPTSARPA
jgi:subtilisin family serine protease